MKINLRQTVAQFLKSHAEERFTARQIALWIYENHRDACEEKRRNSKQDLTSDEAMLWQLVAEIGANRIEILKKDAHIRTTEGRPRRYYFTNQPDETENELTTALSHTAHQSEITGTSLHPRVQKLAEHELYPLLARFLHSEFGLYPKRIDEKRASNRNGPRGNIWLFPDMVAMEDLGKEWHKDIRDCVRHYGDPRCRLWSFEVKLKLNRTNVREAWFQTVSNSAWANQGYLVSAEVEDAATMKELRLLAATHGIGLIVLDAEAPTEGSEIRIPARERTDIDWDACNRLAEENADFRDFIRSVRQFHQTDDIKRNDWDLPSDSD